MKVSAPPSDPLILIANEPKVSDTDSTATFRPILKPSAKPSHPSATVFIVGCECIHCWYWLADSLASACVASPMSVSFTAIHAFPQFGP